MKQVNSRRRKIHFISYKYSFLDTHEDASELVRKMFITTKGFVYGTS
jgi:hypothetical protein